MDRDLLERRRAIERARDDLTGVAASVVSSQIRASWLRCAAVVDTDRRAVPVDIGDDIDGRWAESPIQRAAPHVVTRLQRAAEDGDLLATITDASGRVLWRWMPRWLRPGAERIGLVPGGRWDEANGGTNGVGVALASRQPAVVFSSEHWVTTFRDWVCYAAPVRGPTGRVVGALNLSTKWERDNPLGLAFVGTLARLVEQDLVRLLLSSGRSGIELRLFGHPHALVDGAPLTLTLRQFEILTILTLVRVATLDELHALLYGDRLVSPATLKAEVSHLRRVLGGAIASRPYRLTVPTRSDAGDLLACLDRGDIEGAADLYSAQLLPTSEAPLIVERRHHIDVALRTALLRGGTTGSLLRYVDVHPFDIEVIERAIAVATPDDPLLPAALARLAVAGDDATA